MYYFLMICAFFCSCTPPQIAKHSSQKTETIDTTGGSYRLNSPDKVYQLPQELKEASGLSSTKDPNLLLMVQDEEGELYYFDLVSGAVVKSINFFNQGDFEGIEWINEQLVYAVKSSGTLYQIQLRDGVATSTKISTPLNKSYDVEGLCLDASKKMLLLACKGSGPDSSLVTRNIFSYDLEGKTFNERPFLSITEEMVRQYLTNHPEASQAGISDQFRFGPSGIAIHPITGECYILASSGKLMIVLDSKSKAVTQLYKLDKKVLPQPEGIAFDPAGNLFICSEGKKDNPGLLCRYQYHPK
jgi:uncharacterized protein YjiK